MSKHFDEAKFALSLRDELRKYLRETKKNPQWNEKIKEALTQSREYKRQRAKAHKTAEAIVAFLRSFQGGRYGNITKQSVPLLREGLREIRLKLLKLGRHTKLDTIDLQHHGIQKLIMELFRKASTSLNKRKVQYTCAAKVLFVLEPDLFPLWDGGIRESLGCAKNAEGYLNFMWRMQNLLRNKEVRRVLERQPFKLRALDACLWREFSTSKIR